MSTAAGGVTPRQQLTIQSRVNPVAAGESDGGERGAPSSSFCSPLSFFFFFFFFPPSSASPPSPPPPPCAPLLPAAPDPNGSGGAVARVIRRAIRRTEGRAAGEKRASGGCVIGCSGGAHNRTTRQGGVTRGDTSGVAAHPACRQWLQGLSQSAGAPSSPHRRALEAKCLRAEDKTSASAVRMSRRERGMCWC